MSHFELGGKICLTVGTLVKNGDTALEEASAEFPFFSLGSTFSLSCELSFTTNLSR